MGLLKQRTQNELIISYDSEHNKNINLVSLVQLLDERISDHSINKTRHLPVITNNTAALSLIAGDIDIWDKNIELPLVNSIHTTYKVQYYALPTNM